MRLFWGCLLFLYPLTLLAEQTAPQVGKHVTANMDATSMILSLLVVLVVIALSAILLKRIQPNNSNISALKVITSLHLGAKERLVVVQVGDKQLLLGVTTQQVSLLDTLEQPISAAKPLAAELSSSLLSFFNKQQAKNNNETNSTNG